MLQPIAHGDVVRLLMSSAVSRAAGFTVSAFLSRGALIDSGSPAVARELSAFLDRQPVVGAIITHHHEDHAGNAELLARRGIPLAMGVETRAALREGESIPLHRRLIWGRPSPLVTPAPPFEPEWLTLIPTPGHAPDHQVVWDAERETVFAGDLFLGVKVRVAHPGEVPRDLVASLRRVAELRPRRLFDAHRGLVDDPVDALTAKADWIEETVAGIERLIAAGWSDRAIARELLGREEAAYYVSRGGLSRVNYVRAVRATAPRPAAARASP